MSFRHALFAGLLFIIPGASLAEGVGKVVDFVQGASVTGAEGKHRLSRDLRLSMADVIETDGVGSAQLLFDDGTRIAVGPKSRLVIDEVLMKSSGKASRFAVSAVSGTMRFITGKSAKSAYSITTPTATMGIRGTAFDVSVSRKRRTDLVLFSGKVQMCGAGGCRQVASGCQAVGVDATGTFDQTTDENRKGRLIVNSFPLIVAQENLKQEYRQPIESCGDRVVSRIKAAREPRREQDDRPEPASPLRQPPPPPPPPPPPI